MSISPELSPTSAEMPADDPLGGVVAGDDEFHVLAGVKASFGTVTLAGNGSVFTGGIWVILS
jgi:hypothetical protein